MNYELAKELKDVGFPQSGNGEIRSFNSEDKDQFLMDERPEVEYLYIPILEELIEECEGIFWSLHRGGSDTGAFAWIADTTGKATEEYRQAFGSNPSEAVARLWLALNKK